MDTLAFLSPTHPAPSPLQPGWGHRPGGQNPVAIPTYLQQHRLAATVHPAEPMPRPSLSSGLPPSLAPPGMPVPSSQLQFAAMVEALRQPQPHGGPHSGGPQQPAGLAPTSAAAAAGALLGLQHPPPGMSQESVSRQLFFSQAESLRLQQLMLLQQQLDCVGMLQVAAQQQQQLHRAPAPAAEAHQPHQQQQSASPPSFPGSAKSASAAAGTATLMLPSLQAPGPASDAAVWQHFQLAEALRQQIVAGDDQHRSGYPVVPSQLPLHFAGPFEHMGPQQPHYTPSSSGFHARAAALHQQPPHFMARPSLPQHHRLSSPASAGTLGTGVRGPLDAPLGIRPSLPATDIDTLQLQHGRLHALLAAQQLPSFHPEGLTLQQVWKGPSHITTWL